MTVDSVDINALIAKLSSFGKYQKKNFFFISLAVIFSTVQYSYVFSTRSTKHRCYIEECDDVQENITYNQRWLENVIPLDGETLRKCERYAPVAHNFDLADNDDYCDSKAAFDTSKIQKCRRYVFENDDYMTSIEYEFDLTCEDNLWKLTALGSLDEVGEVVFAPFIGYFSDRLGRKWVLVYCLVLSGVAGLIKSFSPSYAMFAIMEFVSACFTSGIYGSGFILGVELLEAERRVFGSTIIAIAFPFGEVCLGLAAWLSPSWRIMLRVLYAPGLLFIGYYWIIDDSVRFLLANGKDRRARRVINRIAQSNNIDIPDDFRVRPLQPANGPQNEEWKEDAEDSDQVQHESFVQLCRHPSLILRVLNCSFSWISCTFVYYGLTIYSVSLTGNIYLNFIIMAVIELPAYILCYYTLDPLGRRFTLVGSLLLSGAACLACSFISKDIWVLQLVLPIIGKFAATMAFKTIYIYTAEMFPTTLRHTLLAFCSMFGRAGSIAAPQLPILATVSPILPPILFGILGVSAGILAFFLPETTGCKLPDTLEESLVLKRNQDVENAKIDKSI